MKIAYFDCPTGIAGNMILGALLDAGLDKDYLLAELKKLRMANYELEKSKKMELPELMFMLRQEKQMHLEIYVIF